jgi:hypothetical protein
VAAVCRRQFPRIEVDARAEPFRRSAVRAWPADRVTAAFCCVDSIATRKVVWDAVRGTAGFFADGRLAAEVVRVLASGRPAADVTYPSTPVPGRGGVRRQLHGEGDHPRGQRGRRADGRPVRPLAAGPAGRPPTRRSTCSPLN